MIISNVSKAAHDEAYAILPPAYRDDIMGEEQNVAERPFWSREDNRNLMESRTDDVLRALLLLCQYYSAELVKEDYTATNDANLWRRYLYRSANSFSFVFDYDYTKQTHPDKDFWELTGDPKYAELAHTFLPSNCKLLPACLEKGPVGILRWLKMFRPVVEARFRVPYDNSDGEGVRVGFCTYENFLNFRLRPNQDLHSLLVGITRKFETLPLNAYRFSLLSGKLLFLSEIKHKSVEDLGLQDGDVILRDIINDAARKERMESWCREMRNELGFGTHEEQPADEDDGMSERDKKKSSTGRQQKKKKKKRKKKAARKAPISASPDESSNRMEHSRKLSRVLDEADATLRDIRRRLNNLGLKRTPPKRVRPVRSDPAMLTESGAPSAASVDPGRAAGGKAGTIFFDVKVGDAACLYKTSKPRRGDGLDRASPAAALVDLHGRTREEGRAELDSHLPGWIRTAMEGPRPWVIRVRIVVGGGNQVLAEMVEEWIRKSDSVAKAFVD